MSQKRKAKTEQRKGKTQAVANEAVNTWAAVHELAHAVDHVIRGSAEVLFLTRENKSLADTALQYKVEIATLSSNVIVAKESLAAAVQGMCKDSHQVVTEEDYPEYLEHFVNINGIHEQLLETTAPGIKLLVAAIDQQREITNDD